MKLPSHGFLGGSVFASHHAPSEPVRNVGYVVCPPLGYEAIQSYHGLLVLAQDLASAGFHTLRINYHGTGESVGSDDDAGRLDAWLASVVRAVAAFEELGQLEAVGLVGLRLGGTLAAAAAAECGRVRKLVLWEPIAAGAAYARELEIVASATAASRASSGSAPPSPRQTGADDGLLVAGYRFTSQTLAELSRFALDGRPLPGRPDVLIIERDDRPSSSPLSRQLEALGCSVTTQRLPGYKELMVDPAVARVPSATIAAIRQWAIEHSRPTGAATGTPALEREARAGRVRRRPKRFGSSDRLFGVVTEETSGSPVSPAVVLLAGGVVPRTAVNRMFVTLADRLAERGHAVLRVDVSGIGESHPPGGGAWNDPYSASLLEDATTAVAQLESDTVWLVGLCSGAYAAFQTALTEPRVAGITLINPIVFYGRDGMSALSPEVQQVQAMKQYRRSLFEMAKWKKLLSGRVDLRFARDVARARLGTWLRSRSRRGLASDLRRLLARGLRVDVAFSSGDPGYDALQNQLRGSLKDLGRRGLAIHVFDDADHTFNQMGARRQLVDWIVERIPGTPRIS